MYLLVIKTKSVKFYANSLNILRSFVLPWLRSLSAMIFISVNHRLFRLQGKLT